jgi:hypothetical protein
MAKLALAASTGSAVVRLSNRSSLWLPQPPQNHLARYTLFRAYTLKAGDIIESHACRYWLYCASPALDDIEKRSTSLEGKRGSWKTPLTMRAGAFAGAGLMWRRKPEQREEARRTTVKNGPGSQLSECWHLIRPARRCTDAASSGLQKQMINDDQDHDVGNDQRNHERKSLRCDGHKRTPVEIV